MYAYVDRQNLPPIFRTFDFAIPDAHVPQRSYTTVPQQALYLLNHPFAHQAAEELARHTDVASSLRARIGQLYRLALARDPSAEETKLGLAFVEEERLEEERLEEEGSGQQPSEVGSVESPPLDAWGRYAHAVLLSNEFAYVD